jgi:hypothetical protein
MFTARMELNVISIDSLSNFIRGYRRVLFERLTDPDSKKIKQNKATT